jgi:hypothetical protein
MIKSLILILFYRAIGSAAGNPFDVLKTRMMAAEGKESKGIGFHFSEIVKH